MAGERVDLEQRLTELEVRLTFIDDSVHALATADAEQSLRIAALERIVRDLRNELATMRADSSHDPHDEPPPPHY
ncbi:SlyX family protein [Dyella sp.]|jgi:SlyX protein|uniref:SlyX family protein n=1 Tax=Dyella sp. TaxID=1869338 RepID=UPI002D7810E9|nr:SlyX family protein [Dyella sp.]HET6431469.1 SlyX family protein [Dyella sp.]